MEVLTLARNKYNSHQHRISHGTGISNEGDVNWSKLCMFAILEYQNYSRFNFIQTEFVNNELFHPFTAHKSLLSVNKRIRMQSHQDRQE